MKFTNEIFIASSPSTVFLFAGDVTNIPLWNYAVLKIETVTKGIVGKGAVYKQYRNFSGRMLEDVFVITEYEADQKLAFRSIEAEHPFVISYCFKPSGNGTIVTNSFELHGKLAGNILGILFKKNVKTAVAKNLNTLKGLIESQANNEISGSL
jgi:hypothetical protein